MKFQKHWCTWQHGVSWTYLLTPLRTVTFPVNVFTSDYTEHNLIKYILYCFYSEILSSNWATPHLSGSTCRMVLWSLTGCWNWNQVLLHCWWPSNANYANYFFFQKVLYFTFIFLLFSKMNIISFEWIANMQPPHDELCFTGLVITVSCLQILDVQ